MLFRSGPAGSPAVVAHLRDGIQGAITEEMHHRSAGRIDHRSLSRVGAFVAGGVIAAATTWLDDDDRPPADEEAAAVWRMVLASSMPLRDRTSPSEEEPRRPLEQDPDRASELLHRLLES